MADAAADPAFVAADLISQAEHDPLAASVLVTDSTALVDAVETARAQGLIKADAEPIVGTVCAVSVGIVAGEPLLDLDYEEDSTAETDMNVVMTGSGSFIEVQGTAEGAPFDRAELDALLALAAKGCADLTRLQTEALER